MFDGPKLETVGSGLNHTALHILQIYHGFFKLGNCSIYGIHDIYDKFNPDVHSIIRVLSRMCNHSIIMVPRPKKAQRSLGIW